jgi:hypothetical protein
MRTQTVYLVGTMLKTVEGVRYHIGRVKDRDLLKMPDIARNNGYVMIASDRPEASKLPEAVIFPQSGKMFAPFTTINTYQDYFGGKQETTINKSPAMAFDADSNDWYPAEIVSASPDGTIYLIRWQDGGAEVNLPTEYVKIREEKPKVPATTSMGRYSIYVLSEMRNKRQPLPYKAWQLSDSLNNENMAILPSNAKELEMPKLAFNVGDPVQVNFQGVPYPATINADVIVSVNWGDGSGEYLAPLHDVTFGLANVETTKRRGRGPAINHAVATAPAPKAPKAVAAVAPKASNRLVVGALVNCHSPSEGGDEIYPVKIIGINGDVIEVEYTSAEFAGYKEFIAPKDIIGAIVPTAKAAPAHAKGPVAKANNSPVKRAANAVNTDMPPTTVMAGGKPVMLARADGSQFFVVELTPQVIKARKSAGPGRPLIWDIGYVKRQNANLYREVVG